MLELTQVQYKHTTEEASKQLLKRVVNKKTLRLVNSVRFTKHTICTEGTHTAKADTSTVPVGDFVGLNRRGPIGVGVGV